MNVNFISTAPAENPSKPKGLRLFHYSNQPDLTCTDPKAYGTCGAGQEKKRRDAFPETWVPRTYFGTDKYRKEACVGSYRYATEIDPNQLYDIAKDPLDLFHRAEALSEKAGWPHGSPDAMNRFEQEISKRFAGYYAPAAGEVAVFKKMPVRPADESEQAAKARQCALDYKA